MQLSNPIFRQIGIVVLVTTAIVYTAGGTASGYTPKYQLTDRGEMGCAIRGVTIGNACIRRATDAESRRDFFLPSKQF